MDGDEDGGDSNSDDSGNGGDGGGVGITGNSDAEPEESGPKKKRKGKEEKNKGKKSNGKDPAQNGEDSWEDDSEEEDENIPSQPHPEDEEPIKWFEPKDGDYARYNLERVPSLDEEAEAEKRRKKNKKKAESKKRKRLEKKLAEQRAEGDDAEKSLGAIEGPSRLRSVSGDDSDEESVVDSTAAIAPRGSIDPGVATSITPAETSPPGDAEGNTTKPKKKKKKKGKKPTAISTSKIHHPALPPPAREDDPDAAKKTRALVQSIETQFTKFNLGENNELANPTPHHDDGLLAWLPHKDDPTSDSDLKSDEDEGSDDDDSSEPGDSDAESDISIVSTLFGSDPRYPREVNIDFRKLRHKDWLIRVLIETATRTGGDCRDIRISGMKLNGAGQKVWNFDMNHDADLYPWSDDDDDDEWDEEDDEDSEFRDDWDDEDDFE